MSERTIEEATKTGWSFEGIEKNFNSHVRMSVPLYEEAHFLLGEYSRFFLRNGSKVVDIGTSTGKAISAMMQANKDRDVDYLGLDVERGMTNYAQKSLKELAMELHMKMPCVGVLDAREHEYKDLSLVSAMLAFQFIPKKDRAELLYNIYEGLEEGGALIVFEKIRFADSELNEIAVQLYHDFKEDSFDLKEIRDKQNSLRGVQHPYIPEERLAELYGAGFNPKKVEEVLRWNNFSMYVAVK